MKVKTLKEKRSECEIECEIAWDKHCFKVSDERSFNAGYKAAWDKIVELLEEKIAECEEKENDDESDFRHWNNKKDAIEEILSFINGGSL